MILFPAVVFHCICTCVALFGVQKNIVQKNTRSVNRGQMACKRIITAL